MRKPNLAPTPRAAVYREGPAVLYRFLPPPDAAPPAPIPLLLVPSLINRWYVMDLRPDATLAGALLERGLDVFCLDWGEPGDEDRYLGWDDLLARLSRACRRVLRETGAAKVALLGYCMGGTLSAIHAALEPERVAALVDLLGPIDFSSGGFLAEAVDARWFDADAVADAGNVSAAQMQSGFVALRPTVQLSKWIRLADSLHDPAAREAFAALEAWASDNIAFPGEAYRTYIGSLYQRNELVRGLHVARGRRIDLKAIRCPVMAIVAGGDTICPPRAATALTDHCGATDKQVLEVPGGHVGAVIGSRATRELYPALASWLRPRLGLTPVPVA